MKISYVFYYFWSFDRRPCPGKGVKDGGDMIGGNNAIKGAEWEISSDDFLSTPLSQLVERHPWPFGEGEK